MQKAAAVKRVLIYRIGSLGDTVVALPSLHLIARHYAGAEVCMLTNFPVHAKAPAAAAVLGESGLVQGYMRYTAGTRNPLEMWKLCRQIRAWRPDVLVYLMPMRSPKSVLRDRIFFRLCGVKKIVGLPGEAELRHDFDASTGLYESEAHRLARTVRELGDARVEDLASWELLMQEAERERAREALAELGAMPLLVCAPGTKMPCKDWGREKWRDLLARLGRRYTGHALVFAGSQGEYEECAWIGEGWPGRTLNLCGQLSPREVVPLLEKAEIYMGADSGQMHLAAAAGTSCVCVFAARNLPGVWFPAGKGHEVLYHRVDCLNCGLEVCEREAMKCIRSISVEEVEEAAIKALSARQGREKAINSI